MKNIFIYVIILLSLQASAQISKIENSKFKKLNEELNYSFNIGSFVIDSLKSSIKNSQLIRQYISDNSIEENTSISSLFVIDLAKKTYNYKKFKPSFILDSVLHEIILCNFYYLKENCCIKKQGLKVGLSLKVTPNFTRIELELFIKHSDIFFNIANIEYFTSELQRIRYKSIYNEDEK